MLVSYNWLCDYLGEDAPSPERVVELLTQHAFEIDEVTRAGDDTVIDVDVLPNRSSDCLSHRGIAREIAAITGVPLAWDPLSQAPELPLTNAIAVDIHDTELCPRFTASLVRKVVVEESPQWLQDRLRALGQRPINTIVDVTNYVMYGLGQPLHAYDADTFPHDDGVWRFGVRRARPNETIGLLAEGGAETDRVVTLHGEELLITDGATDTPIGLAGVKGGTYAGVGEATTSVIIEAAHFDPVQTRKTARRHKIVIDASKRFENEPSQELPLYAQAEALRLLQQLGPVQHEGVYDVYPKPHTPVTVAVHPHNVNSLLGTTLTAPEMVTLLTRVGCTVVSENDNVLQVTGPWERTDLEIEEDFIEEIGRLHGYHHVAPIPPQPMAVQEYSAIQHYAEAIRQTLLERGFSEVITSSFRKKDDIKLHNALASDKAYLRSSLVKNLTEVLDKNIHHTDLLGVSDVRVFEIGTVFTKDDSGIAEHVALAVGVRIRPAGYSGKEDGEVRAALDSVTETLGINTIDWRQEKGVAEMDLSQVIDTLPTPTEYVSIPPAPMITYRPFSNYPAISRDIALWVPEEIESAAVAKVLDEHAGDLRQRTTLFDEFRKDGRVSYAFRLVFQSHDKTLTDAAVNAYMEQVYAALAERGWEVR